MRANRIEPIAKTLLVRKELGGNGQSALLWNGLLGVDVDARAHREGRRLHESYSLDLHAGGCSDEGRIL